MSALLPYPAIGASTYSDNNVASRPVLQVPNCRASLPCDDRLVHCNFQVCAQRLWRTHQLDHGNHQIVDEAIAAIDVNRHAESIVNIRAAIKASR